MSQIIEHPNGFSYHPSTEINPHAQVGAGTKIWHHCQVHAGAVIGERCTIGHNCTVFKGAVLGSEVTLEANIDVWPGVTLEDGVFVGPSAVFTNDLTPRAFDKKAGIYVPTIVRRGASIGANSVIVCGITIGAFAAIGAGSTIRRDVPAHALVTGNPARFVRWVCLDNCWTPLNFIEGRAICSHCGRSYQLNDGQVALLEAPV